MGNYSNLQLNTLGGFSESAGLLYLELTDALRSEVDAFRAACRYERECGAVLEHILVHGMDVDPATKTELAKFMAARWRHNFMDGGK